MTEARRALGAWAVALVTTVTLTGCTGTDADGLLSESDLRSVDTVKTYNRTGTPFSGCGALGSAESIVSTTDPDTISKVFSTSDGDTVISSLLGVPINEESTAYTITRLDDAIDQCSKEAPEFSRLTDLPGDAIGFRSAVDGSNGGYVSEVAYSAIDAKHVVVLIVQRGDGQEPNRTIKDLMPVALDRARTVVTAKG